MNALAPHHAIDAAIAGASGSPVILLHGSASSRRHWSGLTGAIEGRFRVVTPDLPGYGRDDRLGPETMSGIVAELMPHLIERGQPVHLVGHDFGAVVALECAARLPGAVASLTMIEPVALNAIWGAGHVAAPETAGFRAALAEAREHFVEGDHFAAMGRMIDFWNGDGAWMNTSFGLQREATGMAAQLMRDMDALAGSPISPIGLAGVVCPTLLITGEASPAPMQDIARHLAREIPFLRHESVAGAGHFVHLTDPHVTDPMIRAFLLKAAEPWYGVAPLGLAA